MNFFLKELVKIAREEPAFQVIVAISIFLVIGCVLLGVLSG